MDQPSVNTSLSLGIVDETLSSDRLLPAPKALLLLRICQLAQYLRPELVERYWPQLQSVHQRLAAAHKSGYEELKAALEGGGGDQKQKKRIKALAEIFDAIQAAVARATEQPDEAKQMLEGARARLQKLWWWPFGKAEAWQALVFALVGVDRARSLALVGEAPGRARRSLIVRLNDGQTLTESEWTAVCEADRRRTIEAVTDILDRDQPPLRLPDAVAQAVGAALLQQVHAAAPLPDAERKTEAEREKALARYKKLVRCASENAPDTAESLMEALFKARATTALYKEKWLDRFTSLLHIITFWATVPEAREKARAFLLRDCPEHLRDFALAQWAAMFPSNQAEAEAAWQSERSSFQDAKAAEAYFLVMLVRRGLGREAMAMAQCGAAPADLVPRVRKAVLCEFTDSASLVGAEDVQDDLVGAFLRAASTEDRVEFLRERTENGKKAVPEELWSKPSITTVFTSTASKNAEPNWYKKGQELKTQFQEFLRLEAYGQYSCDHVDPPLLAALVAWDQQYPAETSAVFSRMWGAVEPADWELRLDILRNGIFERCQRVMAANPASFNRLFVEWVKHKLVDSPMRTQEGNMIYTLSLKDITPFLYCLLGAEKLARASAVRCDELLALAMDQYTASDDLVTWAAQLYSSDKGLAALSWEVPAKNHSHREAWQTGIVEASKKQIVNALVAGLQASTATA